MTSVNQFFSSVGEYYVTNGAVHPEDKGKTLGSWAFAAAQCLIDWFSSGK